MNINDFQQLITWSQENYSELPWRETKRDLYRVLVSEIMLQQTTVTTVLPRYDDFLQKFPSLAQLAKANEEELALAWQGLGYYRRAKNLHRAVTIIHQEYSDKFPESQEELLNIPGIGPYTAAALTAIGRDQLALALDGNLQRVFSRLFCFDEIQGPQLQKRINSLLKTSFKKIVQDCGPRKLNEALMDLGRTICKARKTKCDICPLQNSCQAYSTQKVDSFPKKKEKTTPSISELKLLRFLIPNQDGEFLFYQKQKGEWLEGQWELPTACLETQDKDFQQYPQLSSRHISSDQITTAITRYRIRNHWQQCDELEFRNHGILKERQFKYIDPKNSKEHLSTASLKLLAHLSS